MGNIRREEAGQRLVEAAKRITVPKPQESSTNEDLPAGLTSQQKADLRQIRAIDKIVNEKILASLMIPEP